MSLRRIKIVWVTVTVVFGVFLYYDLVIGTPFSSRPLPSVPFWLKIEIFFNSPYILAFLMLLFIFTSAWTSFRLIQEFSKRKKKDKNTD